MGGIARETRREGLTEVVRGGLETGRSGGRSKSSSAAIQTANSVSRFVDIQV